MFFPSLSFLIVVTGSDEVGLQDLLDSLKVTVQTIYHKNVNLRIFVRGRFILGRASPY